MSRSKYKGLQIQSRSIISDIDIHVIPERVFAQHILLDALESGFAQGRLFLVEQKDRADILAEDSLGIQIHRDAFHDVKRLTSFTHDSTRNRAMESFLGKQKEMDSSPHSPKVRISSAVNHRASLSSF